MNEEHEKVFFPIASNKQNISNIRNTDMFSEERMESEKYNLKLKILAHIATRTHSLKILRFVVRASTD